MRSAMSRMMAAAERAPSRHWRTSSRAWPESFSASRDRAAPSSMRLSISPMFAPMRSRAWASSDTAWATFSALAVSSSLPAATWDAAPWTSPTMRVRLPAMRRMEP